MTRSLKAAFPLLPVVWLCACTAPPVYPVSPMAQQLAPSDSILGEACDGHDPSAGLRLSGHTLLVVRVNVVHAGGCRERGSVCADSRAGGRGDLADGAPRIFGTSWPGGLRRDSGVDGRAAREWRAVSGLAARGRAARRLRHASRGALADNRPRAGGRGTGDCFRLGGLPGVRPSNGCQADRDPGACLRGGPAPPGSGRGRRRRHPYRCLAPLPDERPYRTLNDVTNPGFQR